jgi:poly-gamma-glutamate synthesis protein (capsule biosynthesis protein)
MRLLDPTGDVRVTIAAAGDVGAVGAVRARAASVGYGPIVAALAAPMTAADLGIVNLEFPVEAGEGSAARRLRQAHEPALLPALAAAGVGAVSLANNHLMDAGPEGLDDTLRALDDAGLSHFGAGRTLAEARRPLVREVRGQRVVVLGYGETAGARTDPGAPCIAPLDPALAVADLARWRPEADVLVAVAHWGSMYVDYPPPRVVKMAGVLAGGGADLVIGHHPHVLQGVRRIGNCLVCFSLGDAIFDSRSGELEARVARETRKRGAVFTIEWAASPGVTITPLQLDADGVPGLADPTAARAILERLHTLSAGLDQAEARFADESAPMLLRYELQSIGTFIRQGRFDRIVQLLAQVRPRHLPLLWQAVRRMGRSS